MQSVAAPSKKSKAAKPFSCEFVSMTLAVNDVRYACDPIDPGEFGTRSFRLCKRSGDHAVYDVIRQHDGIVACSCPDYIARHQGNGYGLCKHGKALVELGLMPAPLAPAPEVNRYPVTVDPPAPELAPIAACVCGDCQADAQCVEAELIDAGHPSTWSAEADAFTWELGLDARHPEPDGPDGGPSDEDRDDAPEPTFEPAADWEPSFDLDDDPEDRDEWTWEAEAREHLDQSERLSMEELVQRQCDFYAGFGNAAGDMLAGAMAELLSRIQATGATTPGEYDARVDCLDRLALDQRYALGFDAGVAHARSVEVAASAFGHSA
jgi:hypothetical protein